MIPTLLRSYDLTSAQKEEQLVGSLQHEGLPVPRAILSALEEALSLFYPSLGGPKKQLRTNFSSFPCVGADPKPDSCHVLNPPPK